MTAQLELDAADAELAIDFGCQLGAAAAASEADLVMPPDYVVGRSPAMTALYAQMQRLSQGEMAVLICGETGVGKERIARIVHASSRRARGPFLALNCAALPAELVEAELFGVGKAVATGVDPRPGMFAQAEGGTLFLDEVGELRPQLQAKLLRALQEKEVQPVGGRPRRVDVRILAATNADLWRDMEHGRFRRDLYYRLAGFTLMVPPLRCCREDIPALVERFLVSFACEAGIRVRGLSLSALRQLTEYSWPGNVRELENEVRRLVYLCPPGQVIDSSHLPPALSSNPPALPGEQPPPASPARAGETLVLESRLRVVESAWIREVLALTGGNRARAARLLGLSRNGLLKKMDRLGIPGDF